jgi:O-antigen ligase
VSELSIDDAVTGRRANVARPLRTKVAGALDVTIFYALGLVLALVAIPYGSAEPWWQGVFQIFVFVLAGLALIERWLRMPWESSATANLSSLARGSAKLILPLLALIVFALIQIIPSSGNIAGVNVQWTLSWDPLATRVFILQLCALILFGWLVVRYTVTERRLWFLIDTIVVIAFVSAVFGLCRQTMQQQIGFLLPHLKPGFGYAQFINSNHFAFLMEMALGLTLGLVVTRGPSPRRLTVFLIAALVMWVAVVRVNSRGGILSMLCQVVLLAILVVANRDAATTANRPRGRMKRWLVSASLILVLLIGSVMTVVFVGGDPLATRIDTLSIELNQQAAQTYTLRQNIWQATWALIKEHPVTGVGFGGYWIAISRYHHASGETTPQQAHNDYLELMASGGIVGFGIALWFVVVLASIARRAIVNANKFRRAVAMGAIVGIITVAIHSFVDFGLHIPVNAAICTVLVSFIFIAGKNDGKPAFADQSRSVKRA